MRGSQLLLPAVLLLLLMGGCCCNQAVACGPGDAPVPRGTVPAVLETADEDGSFTIRIPSTGGKWVRTEVPARFESIVDRVCVRPATSTWKRVPCEPGALDAGEKQGECWALVEVPAEYRESVQRVCVAPPACQRVWVPTADANLKISGAFGPAEHVHVYWVHLKDWLLNFQWGGSETGKVRVQPGEKGAWSVPGTPPMPPWIYLKTEGPEIRASMGGRLYVRGPNGSLGPMPFDLAPGHHTSRAVEPAPGTTRPAPATPSP